MLFISLVRATGMGNNGPDEYQDDIRRVVRQEVRRLAFDVGITLLGVFFIFIGFLSLTNSFNITSNSVVLLPFAGGIISLFVGLVLLTSIWKWDRWLLAKISLH